MAARISRTSKSLSPQRLDLQSYGRLKRSRLHHLYNTVAAATATAILRYRARAVGILTKPRAFIASRCVLRRYNMDRKGNLDRKTLHAGKPVLKGEKWGMNVWLRQTPKVSTRGGVGGSSKQGSGGDNGTASPKDGGSGGGSGVGGGNSLLPTAPDRPIVGAVGALAIAACKLCGDDTGPIGLCLCRGAWYS